MFKPEIDMTQDEKGEWTLRVNKNYSHGMGYVGGSTHGHHCLTLKEALQKVLDEAKNNEDVCLTVRVGPAKLSLGGDNREFWQKTKEEYDNRPPGTYM